MITHNQANGDKRWQDALKLIAARFGCYSSKLNDSSKSAHTEVAVLSEVGFVTFYRVTDEINYGYNYGSH